MTATVTEPRFTVITAAMNSARLIRLTIESVLSQRRGDRQHKIVDDVSETTRSPSLERSLA